jgi:hypothetical protein
MKMRQLLLVIAWVFLVLAVLALAVFLLGNFGMFGTEKDPLAGVFLIILGQPWVRWVDQLPQGLWPWASAVAPFLNAAILFLLASRLPK